MNDVTYAEIRRESLAHMLPQNLSDALNRYAERSREFHSRKLKGSAAGFLDYANASLGMTELLNT